MSTACRELLEICVGLSAQSSLDQARSGFAEAMARLMSARAVLLMGLNETHDCLVPLASLPSVPDAPVFNLFEAERRQEPISVIRAVKGLLVEQDNGPAMLSELRRLLFPQAADARLAVIAASFADGAFPELAFFLLLDAAEAQTREKNDLALVLARFCAHHNLLLARCNRAMVDAEQLSRSVSNIDRDRQKMRRILPEALSGRLIGRSAAMRRVREAIVKYGPTDLSVLVTGETGTGKELVARELHRLSSRSDGPFVAVNVAAIPEALAETELFGHVKGAFTGANGARAGHVAAANGGTLFLDEIGDMPPGLQAKLLRVLQEKRFHPVGSDVEAASDFRLVAATHHNVSQRTREGLFRDDLYYRLSEAKINLPPLRERDRDSVELAGLHLDSLAERHAQPPKHLAKDAQDWLLRQSFPGNVRELQAIIANGWVNAGAAEAICEAHFHLTDAERAPDPPPEETPSAMTPAPLDHCAADASSPEAPDDLNAACAAFERGMILRSLHDLAGNHSAAARALGLSRTTLLHKLKKHNIKEAAE